jgi:acyl carrier protein
VHSIEDNLIERLTEKFGERPDLSDSLVMLGVDSVGMAELTYEIEHIYEIKVDESLLEVETVQDLADYIRHRQVKSGQ